MRIVADDRRGPEIAQLLQEHLAEMHAVSPPESTHALDIEALRRPGIMFWSAWQGQTLPGCGALQQLDVEHAEIKSMRTVSAYRGQGVASRLLVHMLDEARSLGYRRLSLETGSMAWFGPARALYQRFGFDYCEPFAGYRDDPNSVFMTRTLQVMDRLDVSKPRD